MRPRLNFSLFSCTVLIGLIANITVMIECNLSYFNTIVAICIISAASVVFCIIRFRALPLSDSVILPIVLLLNSIGLAMIRQIDVSLEIDNLNQDLWTLIGIIFCIVVILYLKDYKILKHYMYIFMIAGIILLILPIAPGVGNMVNGSKVWIRIAGFSMQPAEFAKICLLIFFAAYLAQNKDRLALTGKKILGLNIPRIKDFAPIMIVWCVSILILVFQRDLGTSLLFFGMFIAMLYVSTKQISWVLIGVLMFFLSFFASYLIFSHVHNRIDIWLDPFSDEQYLKMFGGSGQLVQGLFGMANGGLFGTGFGSGYPWITPFSNSDFIFTALGETMGLFGTVTILLLYLILCSRCFHSAMLLKDDFGKILLTGIGFSFALQTFVVVGGVTRVIPLTGLVLPFVAKGGTSLLANWILIGLTMVLTENAYKDKLLH